MVDDGSLCGVARGRAIWGDAHEHVGKRMARRKLAIQPSGELSVFAGVILGVTVLCLIGTIVAASVMYNSVSKTIDKEDESLAALLKVLKALNDTITVEQPTWEQELEMGVFIYKENVQTVEGPVNEIIVNRGTGSDDVPASVTMFELGALNTNTTGDVDTGLGIFRISGSEVIDCCAEAGNGCDCIWDRSNLTHSCCGNMTQLNITNACGLTFEPSQALYVSNLVPSANTTMPNGDLVVENLATVAEGRVSYDGGRQIPVAFSEYLIASNTSRRWTMAEVAPCGYPLQGLSNENPCMFGGVRYPVDVISVYQGVSNGCQKNNDANLVKDVAVNPDVCGAPPSDAGYPAANIPCMYFDSSGDSYCPGYVQDPSCGEVPSLPYICDIMDKPTASFFILNPGYFCTQCGSPPVDCTSHQGANILPTPKDPPNRSAVPNVPTKPNSAILDAQLFGSQSLFNSGNCWSNCSNAVISPNPYVQMGSQGSLCQVDSNGQPTPNCPVNQIANLLSTCGSLDAPSNQFYSSAQQGKACGNPPLSPPKTTTAAQIFDSARTYATTPKFPLVDGSVYEVRFGGTPMNFRPPTSLSNNGPQTGGTCGTFNVVSVSDDACGTSTCDFYNYYVDYCTHNCLDSANSSTYNTAYEQRARLSQNSPSMAFQMYTICAAVPSEDDLMGYNPAVFQLMDNNIPYLYDFSSLAQTHQLDGRSYYYINTTKLAVWSQALGIDSSDWMGQCGVFLAATPLMVTSSQQGAFRTFGIDGSDTWNPNDIEPCLQSNIHAQCASGYNQAYNFQTCPSIGALERGNLDNNFLGTGSCCRPDAGQPMGFNHFCQPTNFTMFNSYLEVYTRLPGQTIEPPPPVPTCTPSAKKRRA